MPTTTENETVQTLDIRKEVVIAASPEVVFEVISTPEHLRQWWPDDVSIEPVPGATG